MIEERPLSQGKNNSLGPGTWDYVINLNPRHIEDLLNKEEGQRYNDMMQRKIQNMVEKRDLEEKIEIAEKQLEALSFEIIV